MTGKMQVKGILIPIGGNEHKGHGGERNGFDFIEEGILSHVVKESGGKNAKILIIPTASGIPKEVGKSYVNAFQKLGCNNLKVLDIRKKKQAEEEEILHEIRIADCFMFSGGDQSRISGKIGGSTLHKILQERFINEQIVIAGTSAGAMAMTTEMIAGGSSTEALLKGAVIMREGLGFISELIIDTHFIRRGRFGRMAEAVATFPDLIGVGLAEDTGMIIKNGNEFKVIGSGMIILFDPSQLSHNYHEILRDGTAMSMSNLITHILSNGDRFIFENRKIEILPLKSSFV